MAFLGQGFDSNGRHVISYGNGKSEKKVKATPLENGIKKGPISTVKTESGYEQISPPLSALITRDNDRGNPKLLDGINQAYHLSGELMNTSRNAVVYLDGVRMDERFYTVDYFERKIIIHKNITPMNDEIDVRFTPYDESFYIVENMLILPTCDVITESDLSLYAPLFGDEIKISRIMQYKENIRNAIVNVLASIRFEENGFVMGYTLMPKGIYATLKIVVKG